MSDARFEPIRHAVYKLAVAVVRSKWAELVFCSARHLHPHHLLMLLQPRAPRTHWSSSPDTAFCWHARLHLLRASEVTKRYCRCDLIYLRRQQIRWPTFLLLCVHIGTEHPTDYTTTPPASAALSHFVHSSLPPNPPPLVHSFPRFHHSSLSWLTLFSANLKSSVIVKIGRILWIWKWCQQ